MSIFLVAFRKGIAMAIYPEAFIQRSVDLPTDEQIAALIEDLAAAINREVSYVSRLVTGSGDTVVRIRGGMSMSLRRARSILLNISAKWPADLDWPADIPRPTPSKLEDAA